MKKTLREIIEKYNLNVRITPNQNIILCDIRKAWKRPITTALAQAGLLVFFTYLYFSCSGYLHDTLNVRSFFNINFQFQHLDFCSIFGDVHFTFGIEEEFQDSL